MAGYKHLEILTDFEKYVRDKKSSSRAYYRYLLVRLQRMFQYKNLPDTIPHEILDRYLFEYGIACICEVDGKLYVFSGNLGGPQDVYYRPTEFIISNPHIKTSDGQLFTANVPVYPDFTDDDSGLTHSSTTARVNGVLLRNDTDWVGLHPLISRYAYLLAENTLTLRTADVMLRVIALITAKTDKERASALEYLKSLENGNLGIIGESAFHEGVDLQSPPSQNGSYLTQFIEFQQYLKGSFFGDIGLSANYNMKREAIGKGESTLDQDALLPLAENMLKCRQEDLAKVNDLFGTSITVEFSSSWLANKIEVLSSLNSMGQPTNNFSPFAPTPEGGDVVANDANDANGAIDANVAILDKNGGNEANDGEINGEEKVDEKVEENVDDKENVVDEKENVVDEIPDADGNNGDDKSTEGDNPESKINDLSIDEELTEILEDVKEGNVNEMQIVGQPTEERGEEDGGNEESSENKGSASDN